MYAALKTDKFQFDQKSLNFIWLPQIMLEIELERLKKERAFSFIDDKNS